MACMDDRDTDKEAKVTKDKNSYEGDSYEKDKRNEKGTEKRSGNGAFGSNGIGDCTDGAGKCEQGTGGRKCGVGA